MEPSSSCASLRRYTIILISHPPPSRPRPRTHTTMAGWLSYSNATYNNIVSRLPCLQCLSYCRIMVLINSSINSGITGIPYHPSHPCVLLGIRLFEHTRYIGSPRKGGYPTRVKQSSCLMPADLRLWLRYAVRGAVCTEGSSEFRPSHSFRTTGICGSNGRGVCESLR